MSSRQDNSSSGVLKSWKFWIPIGISIVALAVSIYFACVAKQAREDARAISKLDIYPIVELSTNFQGIRKKPPYFIVKNSGPVPVEQLEVQLLRHMYAAGGTGEGGTTAFAWGSEGLYRVGRLEPWSGLVFEFPKSWLNFDVRTYKPLHHNIIEIRLKYRRPVDLTAYEESAFYFINPEGRWVGEDDNSLPPEVYDPIKSAVFRRASEGELRHLDRDKLHRIVRPE